MGLRESVPRQVDKKSGGPQGERGLEFSRRRKGQRSFFFSTFLSLSHIKHFFPLRLELMITQQTTQFQLLTKDYMGTSLVAQMVKRLPTMRETQVQSLGQKDPLE